MAATGPAGPGMHPHPSGERAKLALDGPDRRCKGPFERVGVRRVAGQPTELAPAYVFLASPESSYVVGATIPVTGGMPTP